MNECNFRSKVQIRGQFCCQLTPKEMTCCGEDNCILFQIYKNLDKNNKGMNKILKDQNQRLKQWADECATKARSIL